MLYISQLILVWRVSTFYEFHFLFFGFGFCMDSNYSMNACKYHILVQFKITFFFVKYYIFLSEMRSPASNWLLITDKIKTVFKICIHAQSFSYSAMHFQLDSLQHWATCIFRLKFYFDSDVINIISEICQQCKNISHPKSQAVLQQGTAEHACKELTGVRNSF